VLAAMPERKQWWRTFRSGSPATLVIRGERRQVTGSLLCGAGRREVCGSGEVRALGGAAVALTAIGAFDPLPAAAAAVSRTDAVVTPRSDAAATYRQLRAVYERVYTQTRDLLHTLHDLPIT